MPIPKFVDPFFSCNVGLPSASCSAMPIAWAVAATLSGPACEASRSKVVFSEYFIAVRDADERRTDPFVTRVVADLRALDRQTLAAVDLAVDRVVRLALGLVQRLGQDGRQRVGL